MTKRGLAVTILLAALGVLLVGGTYYEVTRFFGDVGDLSGVWRALVMRLVGMPFASGICLGSAVTLFVQARRAARTARDADADHEDEPNPTAGTSGGPAETLER